MIVLIAFYGKNSRIIETLESLRFCQKPRSFETVIVVENGTRKYEPGLKKQFKDLNLCYYYYPRPNKSAALNYVIEEIHEKKLIIFTDDDILFEPNFFIEYERIISSSNINDCYFGGSVYPIYSAQPAGWVLQALTLSMKGFAPQNRIDYLGANWAVSSELIKKAGMFDINRGPGTKPKRTGQETEMQKRLRQIGVKPVAVPESVVYHRVLEKEVEPFFILNRKFQSGFGKGIEKSMSSDNNILLLVQLFINFGKDVVKTSISLLLFSKAVNFRNLAKLVADIGQCYGILSPQYISDRRNRFGT